MSVDYDEVARTLINSGRTDFHHGLLRYIVTGDPNGELTDYDCYGMVAPVSYNRDLGTPNERPDGFNDLAEIITIINGDQYWWQPTPDLWGFSTAEWLAQPDNIRTTRTVVTEILSFGFKVLTVEYCEGLDAYNRPIVRGLASVGGVEPITDINDEHFMVVDLIHEALLNAGVLV